MSAGCVRALGLARAALAMVELGDIAELADALRAVVAELTAEVGEPTVATDGEAVVVVVAN